MSAGGAGFQESEVAQFERDGYFVARGLGDPAVVRRMLEVAREGVAREIEPIEFEADLQYPGAPSSRDTAGGRTVRRLKQALARDPVFALWLQSPELAARVRQLVGETVVCPLAHHNCVMTKHPRFSSETGWHQDIRYWAFARPELITAWLALGAETEQNGCLWVIPGSHQVPFERERFDDALFFRSDLAENRPLIERAIPVELEAGDVLFFHCRTLHSAGRNTASEPKMSVVFTFRSIDNPPRPGTRSAAAPELLLHNSDEFGKRPGTQ